MYRHNSITSSVVLFDVDNQTRNGFKWSVVVIYEAPTSGTHTGGYHGNNINMERRLGRPTTVYHCQM